MIAALRFPPLLEYLKENGKSVRQVRANRRPPAILLSFVKSEIRFSPSSALHTFLISGSLAPQEGGRLTADHTVQRTSVRASIMTVKRALAAVHNNRPAIRLSSQ